FQVDNRVADMTVVGSNAAYRTLRADHLARVPAGVDAAEAAALILSWTTAYQLLHRAARVQRGQRVLVQGAAGAVGQALLVLGRLAGVELWGTARGAHAALIRELGATPIDYQREDFTRVLPGGFDVVFDGIGEDGCRRSFAALKRGGLVCAYGYTAGVQAQRRLLAVLMWIARLYLWRRLLSWLPGGKRLRIYSINAMRARHPAWFREDLERLFGLLATRAISPRVAQRISFDEIAEAHRRLEAGGLDGKLVLCPDLSSRRDRVPPQREPGLTSVPATPATLVWVSGRKIWPRTDGWWYPTVVLASRARPLRGHNRQCSDRAEHFRFSPESRHAERWPWRHSHAPVSMAHVLVTAAQKRTSRQDSFTAAKSIAYSVTSSAT